MTLRCVRLKLYSVLGFVADISCSYLVMMMMMMMVVVVIVLV